MPNPLVVGGAIKGVQALFSGLGANKRKKRRNRLIEDERKRLLDVRGKDVFDPFSIQNLAIASNRSRTAEFGRKIDKTLKLDTGQGLGALAERELTASRETLTSNIVRNKQLVARRNEDIDRLLFDISLEEDVSDVTLDTISNIAGIAGNTAVNVLAQNQAQEKATHKHHLAAQETARLQGNIDRSFEAKQENLGIEQGFDERGLQLKENQASLLPQPKSLQEFVLQGMTGEGLSQEQLTLVQGAANALKGLPPGGKPDKLTKTPDFASESFGDLSKFQDTFQKGLAQFNKTTFGERETSPGSNIFRPTTVEDFTKQTGTQPPDFKAIFDKTMADEINRTLGAGAADSVFNQIAPLLGIDPQVAQADTWGKKAYGKDWDSLTEQQKLQLFGKYGTTQPQR